MPGLQSTLHSLGPWFHNLHLPDGTQTAPDHPLGDFPAFKWRMIAPHLPADLTGLRVLDVGCNAGFYSLELARRGATVLAVDVDSHYLAQARWAAEQFEYGSRITFQELTVYDLARLPETFDIVWFMGVFYHLRYPQLALDILAERTAGTLVFQTLMVPGDGAAAIPENLRLHERDRLLDAAWPKLALIEHRLEDDPTNWWLANDAAVRALLRMSGFTVTATPDYELYLCQKTGVADEWQRAQRRSELQAATGVQSDFES